MSVRIAVRAFTTSRLAATALLAAAVGLGACAGPEADPGHRDASSALDAASPDAATPPGTDAGPVSDAGPMVGTLQLSPAAAEQGASQLEVRVVAPLLLDPADLAVAIDPAAGAAISAVQVTGDHRCAFLLDVAADAPIGVRNLRVGSGGGSAVGPFEIVERTAVTRTLEFLPATLPRGQTTAVALRTRNIDLSLGLQVSFPPGSGVQVQDLAVVSPAEATMRLQVDGAAPLGAALATVTDGSHDYHPAITITEGPASALRIVEVMPHPGTLGASYVELANTAPNSVTTAGWTLAFEGGASLSLPERTLAAGERLLLASDSGVPGGAVVVNGLELPLPSGRLLLRDASGAQVDAVRWDLADGASAARAGVSMGRVDPLGSGEVATNWRSAQTLIRAPVVPTDWAGARGSPGLPSFVGVGAQDLGVGAPVTSELGATSVAHHPLTAARGAWVAVQADVDRVAGNATAALFAVDPATDLALTPIHVATSFGDALAVLEIPAGSGVNAVLDLRVWADPLESFEPSPYTARIVPVSGLEASPASLALLPGDSGAVAIAALFDGVEDGGATLSVPVPSAKLEFQSEDPAVATVDDAGRITAVKAGSSDVIVTLAQPAGARTVRVPVRVGDDSAVGDTCESAVDVTSGAHLPGQSTLGATDDYDPRDGAPHCPAGLTDADRVYVVRPAAATVYRVTVTPEGQFDPILYAVTDCAMQECVAGTALWGPGAPETILFQAAASSAVYIVVDGKLSSMVSRGNYTLDVVIE